MTPNQHTFSEPHPGRERRCGCRHARLDRCFRIRGSVQAVDRFQPHAVLLDVDVGSGGSRMQNHVCRTRWPTRRSVGTPQSSGRVLGGGDRLFAGASRDSARRFEAVVAYTAGDSNPRLRPQQTSQARARAEDAYGTEGADDAAAKAAARKNFGFRGPPNFRLPCFPRNVRFPQSLVAFVWGSGR